MHMQYTPQSVFGLPSVNHHFSETSQMISSVFGPFAEAGKLPAWAKAPAEPEIFRTSLAGREDLRPQKMRCYCAPKLIELTAEYGLLAGKQHQYKCLRLEKAEGRTFMPF